MKHALLASALLLSINVAYAKKSTTRKAPKLSKEDARELCITSNGAGISEKEIKKCTKKAMRTGKI